MINPKKELFWWGPILGRPIYISYFAESIANRSPKLYKWRWPEWLFFFIKDKMTFIAEDKELRVPGKKYFEYWIMDDKRMEVVKERYSLARKNLHQIHKKITNLWKLNNEQFNRLFLDWQEAYLQFWDHGLVPELANWGGEIILRDKLKKLIEEKDFLKVYEKLTAPTRLSFYLEEELDLLKVKKGLKTITEHQQEYYWINNSYLDSSVLKEDYFKKRLVEWSGIELDKEIKRIENIPKLTKKEKDKLVVEYQLGKKIKKISEKLSYCIYWQDWRKGDIFRTNHFIKILLQELSVRKGIPFAHLEQYWCWELPELLEGKPLGEKIIKQRLKQHYGYMAAVEGGNKLGTGSDFEKVVNPFLIQKVDKNISEIKGMSVSVGKGIVVGKARILTDPRHLDKMKKGEILIAGMTSPEYILAMKKAVALVTDSGGMTCHAAIVARELGIPGIVSTKIATKVFKDGDIIEVDANKGVVRKCSK